MKKRKKLALQVSAAVTLMLLVTLALIGSIVIVGTRNMYIESNIRKISNEAGEYRDLFMDPDITLWVFDEWLKDPEAVTAVTDDEELLKMQSDYEFELMYSEFARTIDLTAVEAWSEKEKLAFLRAVYVNLTAFFDEKRGQDAMESVYCYDIRDYDGLRRKDSGDIRVLFECSPDTDETGIHKLGTAVPGDSSYTVIDTMILGGYDDGDSDILFREYEDPGKNILKFVAVIPVPAGGQVRYVLCCEYNWSSFEEILNVNLKNMIVPGIIGLLATNLLLAVFIYFKAVRPTVRVTAGVRRYIEDKNSAYTVKKLTAISERNEIGRLADSVSGLIIEIERYNKENLRLTAERERVAAELDLAARIQNDVLPAEFPDMPEFSLFASMDPAKEVGGDFYDFFFVDSTHLGLVIADVSGKGVPAALFMMMSKMLVKNYAMMGLPPAEVLNRTNAVVCENNRNKMFVTVWFAVLDIVTGHVTAANGGHEYPMIRKPDGKFEMLKDKHGFVLGAMKKKKYTEYGFDLEPGGAVFVYTDGAAEATDSGNELFGTERMLEVLNREPDALPEKLLGNMTSAVGEFVGTAPQFDDLTMLCLKYNGKTEE